MHRDEEDELMRSVAVQNAQSIVGVRRHAEQELIAMRDSLRASNEALAARERELSLIYANISDVMYFLAVEPGGHFRFLSVNPAFLIAMNMQQEQVVGKLLQEVMPEPSASRLLEHCQHALRAKASVRWEESTPNPSGKRVGEASVTPLFDSMGRCMNLIGTVHDISERIRAEEREHAARCEAERANQAKDEFLATLSHELRTPLSAILGWSYILRRENVSAADFQQGLDAIERNGHAQTQLIGDLLDMTRITSGKVHLDLQPCDPAACVNAAVATVTPTAIAKEVRLETVQNPLRCTVSGDPERLQQVIWNLISNAIKFTPKGGSIRVTTEQVNSEVAIKVADTGIGIEASFLPHVFERFQQADASVSRRYGGLGLGLSIAKHLVELHGGTLQAESSGEGRGATFTVRLPVASTSSVQPARPETQSPVLPSAATDGDSIDLTGIKVVVVDDEVDACELVRRGLAHCGAEVFTAINATEALVLVENERPHVLVSDIGMPDVDGFELLRRIRALGSARGGNVPAIALTAFARPEDRKRVLHAGFLVHIPKPVEPAELLRTVARVAERKQSEG